MIGKLRERVTFQQESRVADGGGGHALSWANIGTNPTVWARVKPISGREQIQAMQLAGILTHRVTVRHRTDITTSMKIVWGSISLNIRSIINPDEKSKYLELLCEEKVAV